MNPVSHISFIVPKQSPLSRTPVAAKLLCKGAQSSGRGELPPTRPVISAWMRQRRCLSSDSRCSVDCLRMWLVRLLKALCLAPEIETWRWHLSPRWRRWEGWTCVPHYVAINTQQPWQLIEETAEKGSFAMLHTSWWPCHFHRGLNYSAPAAHLNLLLKLWHIGPCQRKAPHCSICWTKRNM